MICYPSQLDLVSIVSKNYVGNDMVCQPTRLVSIVSEYFVGKKVHLLKNACFRQYPFRMTYLFLSNVILPLEHPKTRNVSGARVGP